VEDDEGMKECPACGRHIHRDVRRCYHCGERLEADRPRRRREPERRDWEPHRGGLILTLGIISLVALTVCWMIPLIGLIPGLIAWVMGQSDLRKIKARAMDPEGQGLTQGGWVCGIIGTALNGLLLVGCLGFLGIALYSDANRAATTRPKFGAPPPQQPWQNKPPPWPNQPPGKKKW
jgi:hypothetical protein